MLHCGITDEDPGAGSMLLKTLNVLGPEAPLTKAFYLYLMFWYIYGLILGMFNDSHEQIAVYARPATTQISVPSQKLVQEHHILTTCFVRLIIGSSKIASYARHSLVI